MIVSSEELKIGQFVKSKAGRDKDKIFIVVGIADAAYVYIADGDMRKLEKPKRKKVKHLIALDRISEAVAGRSDEQKRPNNALLRSEIEDAGLI
jgi:ribosomal protein L14E/L6E/L27E